MTARYSKVGTPSINLGGLKVGYFDNNTVKNSIGNVLVITSKVLVIMKTPVNPANNLTKTYPAFL